MKAEVLSMKMRVGTAAAVVCVGLVLLIGSGTSILLAQDAPSGSGNAPAKNQTGPGDRADRGGRGGGAGMMAMGGRGVQGTVTAAAATELTVKTELGDSYKIQFNENTRFMKDRQQVKSSDIKVGDVIMAAGNIDASAKTVGAAFVVTLDAEQVKRIQDARASYGKTWLGGKITAIDDTKISITGVDGKPASFVVDENTSFKKRKESITLADVKAGDAITVRGAVKAGTFVATEFQLMEPRGERGPNGPNGPSGGPGGATPGQSTPTPEGPGNPPKQ